MVRIAILGRERCGTLRRAVTVTVTTERLVIRPAVEDDRTRFVSLFTNAEFMEFGVLHDHASANERFDRMLDLVELVAYTKQPVIERASGEIVGYTGVDSVRIDGMDRLEWGWRLVPSARGRGFATEATGALLGVADRLDDGEMLCLIAPSNRASHGVARKLGFRLSHRVDWDGDPSQPTDVLLRPVGSGGGPLILPEASVPPTVTMGPGAIVTLRAGDQSAGTGVDAVRRSVGRGGRPPADGQEEGGATHTGAEGDGQAGPAGEVVDQAERIVE